MVYNYTVQSKKENWKFIKNEKTLFDLLKRILMTKNNFRLNHLFFLILIALFQSCNSQTKDNPQYIGLKYGSFDIDKVTFTEKPIY
ncbi:hypothetical protein GCM10023210_27010 [Chryseobacterium ginsengisoli]|uniref:Lipoprotein n=1 Tax=Chryseobacterium ginsengisoli TaxID=363853 RepID=A0ABP9MD36_9FLAO